MLSGDYSCGRVKAQRRSGRTVQCSLLASEVARGRGIPDKMHPHEVMPCACFQLLFNARPKSSTVFRSAKTTLPLSRGNTEKTRRDSVVAITQHRLLCKKRATLSMFLVLDTGKDNTRLSLVQQKLLLLMAFLCERAITRRMAADLHYINQRICGSVPTRTTSRV